ncbi:nicotinate phosphoribosyltransferase [Cytophagaceae bacterium ABcell3]|nr:nicotinate phosphoribosyltransferase [Cytophagaceae bacterium ABcell3]
MAYLDKHLGLYTDLYELKMAQAFLLDGKGNCQASFDYFFRKTPFSSPFVVFSGLSELLESLQNLAFSNDDINYLKNIGFDERFLEYLSHFSFKGEVCAATEGDIVFPYEPIITIKGNIVEAQLIETLLLNIINFESLIATKAFRIKQAAGNKQVIDFGLRRAQGLGGIHGSKASVAGGANSTSNVYSAFLFDLVPSGTMAHSFVQSYENELEAFRVFAENWPDKCVLLVDTYDTLRMGMPAAITIAKEMEQKGQKLYGIRLDSGDLNSLSKEARKMLDEAGLPYVKIVASSQLDEEVIHQLENSKAPIDAYGVGTSMITGKDSGALDGVYKLSYFDGKPRLKISEDFNKIILPGYKKVIRTSDYNGIFFADIIAMENENLTEEVYDLFEKDRKFTVKVSQSEPLLSKVMDDGKILVESKAPYTKAQYTNTRFQRFSKEKITYLNFPDYNIWATSGLIHLRSNIVNQLKSKYESFTYS